MLVHHIRKWEIGKLFAAAVVTWTYIYLSLFRVLVGAKREKLSVLQLSNCCLYHILFILVNTLFLTLLSFGLVTDIYNMVALRTIMFEGCPLSVIFQSISPFLFAEPNCMVWNVVGSLTTGVLLFLVRLFHVAKIMIKIITRIIYTNNLWLIKVWGISLKEY